MTSAVLEEKKKYDDELLAKVRQTLEKSEIDQATLAKRVGKSATTISQYLKKSYPGDVEKLEAELRKYLKLSEGAKEYKSVKLNFENTSIAKKIFDLAKMCKYNCEIGVCYGSSGLGKTTALKQLKEVYPGIILVDPDENSTPRAVLKQVADGLKLGVYDPMPEDFIRSITNKLKQSGYLIVVDEAENLKSEVFRTLRKIHDRCEGTCGLMFVGTEKLDYNLTRLKGEFSYVINRVGFKAKLDLLTDEDVEILVKQIYPDASVEVLQSFAQNSKYNARVLFHLLRRTGDMLKINNGLNLSPEVVLSARQVLY